MNFFSKTPIIKSTVIKGLLLVVLMSLGLSLSAQRVNSSTNPRKANLGLIYRADTDSVVLRWAPDKAGGWVIANQIGYVVEKLVINKNTDYSKYERLNESPLKPLSLEEWKVTTDKNNMFSAVAAQALYGELFNPQPMNSGDFNSLRNAADELANRYSFSLFAADNDAFTASVLGLRWVDKDVEEGKRYAYRVYVAEKSDQYSFDTAYIVVDVVSHKANPAPKEFTYKSGDGNIKLFWEENDFDSYTGYYIYRSEDGGNNFTKLNDMPLVTVTSYGAYAKMQPRYIDTATHNYKEYIYEVRGVSPFAELSMPSRLKASSRDFKAPIAPSIKKPEQISATEMKISWEMQSISDDLQGFIISRSNSAVDGFQFVNFEPLAKNTTEYIVDMGNVYQQYFNVAAVDTAGNMSFSLPVLAERIDTAPPAIPTGLRGQIDDEGNVILQWNKSPEGNVKGYRILMANDPTHEFIQVTGEIHPDTVFLDETKLRTLTRRIYYRIAAVNDRYQHSEMSGILTLERPDIIPPGVAVFEDVFVTDSSVHLKWFPSASDDLATQLLKRKKQGESNWTKIDSLTPSTSSFVDKEVKKTIMYEYILVGVDSAGLFSDPSMTVTARPYDTGERKQVSNLTAEYIEDNKVVILNWEYKPQAHERTWYVIYKAIGQGDYMEYKSVSGENSSFVDNKPNKGSSSYGVVVMTSYGGESGMAKSSEILIAD